MVSAYEEGGVTLAEIAGRFSVGPTVVKKRLRQKRATGSVERLPQCAGAKKSLSVSQRTWLAKQARATPDATLSELQEQLAHEQNVKVSPATVCRERQALRLPREKSQ